MTLADRGEDMVPLCVVLPYEKLRRIARFLSLGMDMDHVTAEQLHDAIANIDRYMPPQRMKTVA